MKKTMKKVLALVLTVLMCVSVALPVVAADATCPGASKDHYKTNCSYTKISSVDAACGTDGHTLYQCNGCSKYFIDDIVPAKQAHEKKNNASVAPSCTQQGYDICKHCGAKFNIVEGSGEGHNYVEFTAANKVTSGSPAGKWYPTAKDKDCNYTKWETVCLNDWSNKGTKKGADCTAKSTKAYDGELDNHEWKLVSVITAPTCSVDGSGNFKCDVCSTTKTLAIDAVGHTTESYTVPVAYKAATCTVDGNIATTACADCGAIPASAVIPAFHTVDVKNNETDADGADGYADCFAISLGAAATCTTAGYNLIYCATCEYTDARVIKSLGHDRGELLSETAPTCAVKGSKVYEHVCTRGCDEDSSTSTGYVAGVTVAADGKATFEIDVISTAHNLEFKTYVATCQSVGYTIYECVNDRCDHEERRTNTTTTPDLDNHVWVWSTQKYATCTAPGIKVASCVCGAVNETTETIPALTHKFYTVNAQGKMVFDSNYKVGADVQPTCKTGNGYELYRCMNDNCPGIDENGTAATYKRYTDALKYDAGNYAHHTASTAENAPVGTSAGDCLTVGYNTYLCTACEELFKVAIPGTGEHIAPTGADFHAKVPVGCDDPHTPDYVEGEGYAEFWKCTRCDYYEGALVNKDGKYVDYDGTLLAAGATPKPIKYNARTHENLVAGKAATCTEDGYKATWDCSLCETKFTSESVGYVLTKLGHEYGNGVTGTQANEWKVQVTAAKCGEYSYTQLVCARCKADKITGYAYQDHAWSTTLTPATCEKGSYYACTFGTCTAEKAVDPKLGHIDANGNVIKCATAENFKCYRTCCADDDATTGCNKTENSWKTTHDFVVTQVAATCVAYDYELHTCKDCQYYEVINGFTKLDHNWVFDKTITAATYKAAGEDQYKCTGCKQTEKRPTQKTDMQISFATENAKNNKADIVNSGLVAVTVKTSSYKLPIWGLELSIAFNNQVVEFAGYEAHNATFKEYTKVAAKNVVSDGITTQGYVDRADIVTIAAYAPNGTDGKAQNIEVNGDKVAFVTVYFRVLDNVAPGTTIAFETNSSVVEVVKKDASEVTVSSVGTIASMTVMALGDVNKDADHTVAGYATIQDAIALKLIVEKADGTYNAMADINKDGKVDLTDFGYLMQYITGEIAYNELCAIGVKA